MEENPKCLKCGATLEKYSHPAVPNGRWICHGKDERMIHIYDENLKVVEEVYNLRFDPVTIKYIEILDRSEKSGNRFECLTLHKGHHAILHNPEKEEYILVLPSAERDKEPEERADKWAEAIELRISYEEIRQIRNHIFLNELLEYSDKQKILMEFEQPDRYAGTFLEESSLHGIILDVTLCDIASLNVPEEWKKELKDYSSRAKLGAIGLGMLKLMAKDEARPELLKQIDTAEEMYHSAFNQSKEMLHRMAFELKKERDDFNKHVFRNRKNQ